MFSPLDYGVVFVECLYCYGGVTDLAAFVDVFVVDLIRRKFGFLSHRLSPVSICIECR